MKLVKQKKLDKIIQEIENCKVCKKDKIGKAVPGEGNCDALIIFVGEAPGKLEAETGRPFVGRSGKLLRSLITSVGLKEEDVFITSAVKYLPIYGTPKPRDIIHGKTHLLKQIEIINPKIVVLLGNVAIKALINKTVFLTKEHGQIIEQGKIKYFPTFHPAAALRFVKNKPILVGDFKKLEKIIRNGVI